ncbi:uncharacterized protein LOC127241529 [Andrographis paniculata]|uniref:uncharacterized protein LOC127241529 n=1 Tax=Andrographis paniculata TaxID=175694 RepID=UPI0021E7AA22|nr:uncharacterized protein LOC127241529 [Andrographis paniculata]XP_051116599.1 uncharacterized protein LOC127241529 [Andrographis paniculata]
MGRSDDSISRRKVKKSRKKQEKQGESSSKVSNRVAALIAAKKRRHSGKRRMCQGMCFSLPTPEDPFNERQVKSEPTRKRKRDLKVTKKLVDKKSSRLKNEPINDANTPEDLQEKPINDSTPEDLQEQKFEKVKFGKLIFSSFRFPGPEIAINLGKSYHNQTLKWDGSNYSLIDRSSESNKNYTNPSMFLSKCFASIEDGLQNGGALNDQGEKPIYTSEWGIDFWDSYCVGKDVLETDEANSTTEQIAWIAVTAADTISMKKKEGLSLSRPFLLYLVPSQEKASEVRQVCKPLKKLGIHTVSLHPGASIDHQINGLKSCEPEFLVATPVRLLELLSLKAVDVSGVSVLVIDGLKAPFEGSYFNAVKSVRQSLSDNIRIAAFSDCMTSSKASKVDKSL